MKSCLRISSTKEEIKITITPTAKNSEIVEEFNLKLPRIKKYFEKDKKPIRIVGKDLTDNGLEVHVIPLRDNLDPDEYVLKYGKESFVNLYNNPINYSEFRINYIKEGVNLNDIEEKTTYINNILKEGIRIYVQK